MSHSPVLLATAHKATAAYLDDVLGTGDGQPKPTGDKAGETKPTD
jgi:hypothetical protein